ncbi:hypothetical protein DM806_13740 [Sphingobium lactosutens]|uniref:hypothetical protein n=1 Tax=Sphingobium lactosutens TaxID=522773 RepID=UPI0015B84DC5|nr:hypothetical protein [Sphingobium lactosutens]NWK96703.1 hypothetical protein [Sphingobium lactosutens]
MATVYEQFAKAATQLYDGPFGGAFVLRRLVTAENIDENGNIVPAVTRDFRVRGVVRDKDVWNNGAYLGQKRVAYLSNKTAPFPDDQLIIGKDTYTVDTVTTVAPNGVTVIRYEAVLR